MRDWVGRGRAQALVDSALEHDVNVWKADEDTVLISLDETTTQGEIDALGAAWGFRTREAGEASALPKALGRLGHAVAAARSGLPRRP